LKTVSASSIRIAGVLDVRGFGVIVLLIIIFVQGADWLARLVQLASLWRYFTAAPRKPSRPASPSQTNARAHPHHVDGKKCRTV
jgi:hypothetical protein